MSIYVNSEIQSLKKVLLHRPGSELEHLVPQEMERLLFDDIPFLQTAQKEHDAFSALLSDHGVEVVYLEDLMAEVLEKEPALKKDFLTQFVEEAGTVAQAFSEQIVDYLMGFADAKTLVMKTMAGVSAGEIRTGKESPLVDLLKQPSRRFLLDPIPNLYFTRDPFASIGSGASLHKMYSSTRRRETIYGQYILRHHPDFAGTTLYYERELPYSIEGGDILVLSEDVLAVGISQRTSPEAIETLAKNLFAKSEGGRILAIYIPGMRAFMHLDTVFTQVDRDKFVIHPGILSTLRIFELRPGAGGGLDVRERAEEPAKVLAEALGLERAKLIECGGGDRIAAEREQWNDGSNTLCIEPGKVVVYDRNRITNEILRAEGIEVLEIPGSELSRGRGGPRCMSMPLQRAVL